MVNRLEETVSLFKKSYQETAEANEGAFLPSQASEIMAALIGFANNPEVVQKILEIMMTPTAEIYPDVELFMKQILEAEGSFPMIWTAGEIEGPNNTPGYQLLKVHATGLTKSLSPMWEQKAITFGLPTVTGGINKLPAFKNALRQSKEKFEQVRVVDDRLRNLLDTQKIAEEDGWQGEFFQIHRDEIKATDELHHGVRHIRSLEEIDIMEGVLLAIDYDYTISDHAKTKKAMGERLHKALSTL